MNKVLYLLAWAGSVCGMAMVILFGIAGIYCHEAHADPKPGLWQEQSTTANNVRIQKIRDTTGSDHNVCYIASREGTQTVDSFAVSISCVAENKP